MNNPGDAPPPHQSWVSVLTNLRSFAALFLVVAGVGGAYILGSRLTDDQALEQRKVGAQVGFLAPDIALPTLEGPAVSLSSLRGQVVMLNLWASWCGPCRAEMPAINRIYQAYRAAGFVVLGVNATSQDNEASARSFVQSQGLLFPILLDRDGSVGRAYRLRSLPTSYFVGRDGVIREIVIGGMSEAMLDVRVQRLLAGGR